MHALLSHKKILALAFFFIFLVFLAASLYIEDAQSEYILKTQLTIAEQETRLAAIAELTARDGADAVVEEIIKDCTPENRERFDTLLSSLSQLGRPELREVESLFSACGNFYAERKAVMVSRLSREFEVYEDLIGILALFDKKAYGITYNVSGWKELVEMEQERSRLSTQLVQIQGDIIDALLAQSPIGSDEMQALLAQGQETKDSLELLSIQIDKRRQELLDL